MKIKTIPRNKFENNYNNIIKWSNFKHKIYNECKRKFLYKYVGSLIDPSEKDEIEKLKKLKTLNNWLGETIHKFIDISINLDSIDLTIEKFNREFENTFKHPQDKILEYFYSIPLSNSILREIHEIANISLNNFWYYYQKNIRKNKENIIFRDSMNIQSFSFQDITILYKPDLVLKKEFLDNYQIVIYDWKTKETEFELNQFKLYHLVYSQQGIVITNIVTLYNTLKQEEIKFDDQSIYDYIQHLKNSYQEIKTFIEQMRKFTQNQYDNLYQQIYQEFPKTQNTKICQKCEFKKICYG